LSLHLSVVSALAIDYISDVSLLFARTFCKGNHSMKSRLSLHAVVCSLAAACVVILVANNVAAWTTPEEAAEFLRGKKGITVNETPGPTKLNERFYMHVKLTSDWVVEPKDWLYIPSLAREIEGTKYVKGLRHPLSIDVLGAVEPDTLAECFANLREVKGSPFDLFIFRTPLNRKALLTLAAYPGLTGLSPNEGADDLTDEDWAKCIAAWPKARSLFLSRNAGPQAIAAASKLEHLIILKLRNTDLKEADLAPLRKNMKLQVLWMFESDAIIEYVNQKGTGKWQREQVGR
jgi:hypothetical protein